MIVISTNVQPLQIDFVRRLEAEAFPEVVVEMMHGEFEVFPTNLSCKKFEWILSSMASTGKQPATSQPGPRAQAGNFAYQPVLDGWRAISILLVVVSHGGLGNIVPGGLGVTIFFFISGFLITSLLISEFHRDQQISVKNFYLRRFWRLSPPLIVYIVLSTLLILLCAKHFNYLEPLSAILYFANYYSIYWHYEALPFGPSPLKILWSLAIEEHFYIFFAPLMAFFAHTRKRLFTLMMILIAVPLLIRLRIILSESSTLLDLGYTYMATETRIDSIAWGTLLAWLCYHASAAKLKSVLDSRITVAFSLALMLLCMLVRDDRFRESIRYTLQGFALIPLFHVTLNGETLHRLRKVLASRMAVLIGKLSYSIYLYHWLALVIAGWLVPARSNSRRNGLRPITCSLSVFPSPRIGSSKNSAWPCARNTAHMQPDHLIGRNCAGRSGSEAQRHYREPRWNRATAGGGRICGPSR